MRFDAIKMLEVNENNYKEEKKTKLHKPFLQLTLWLNKNFQTNNHCVNYANNTVCVETW